jgi:hypothetical protein
MGQQLAEAEQQGPGFVRAECAVMAGVFHGRVQLLEARRKACLSHVKAPRGRRGSGVVVGLSIALIHKPDDPVLFVQRGATPPDLIAANYHPIASTEEFPFARRSTRG